VGPEQCAGPTPTDDNAPEYHGTRVAGLAAAETNNANDMAGVARNCKIMAIKALNSAGSAPYSTVAAAILYAVDNGANVINMSLGGSASDTTVTLALQEAENANIIVVAAAGNESTNDFSASYPAAYNNVIAVAATDRNDQLASFSIMEIGSRSRHRAQPSIPRFRTIVTAICPVPRWRRRWSPASRRWFCRKIRH
jgi:subtilisin family serine protease